MNGYMVGHGLLKAERCPYEPVPVQRRRHSCSINIAPVCSPEFTSASSCLDLGHIFVGTQQCKSVERRSGQSDMDFP